MKILTLTCHDVYNHGASLQAYGLMKYLSDCGHDVQIIDYKPDYLSNHYNILSINNPNWEKNSFTKFIYLTLKIPFRLMSLKRKWEFDKFTANYLNLTKTRYISNQQLKKDTPIADIYICGSDQIWNSFHQNGRDPAFYLDFVPQEKVKAAYAASFATDFISDEYKPLVKEQVKKLDAVGVREKSGINILKGLGIETAIQVVDPAFLIDKTEWDKFEIKEFDEKFILVYDFDNNELIKDISKKIADKYGFKIYSLNDLNYVDKNFKYKGPEYFISLIKNAQFVIANSFHGAVFSIIYEKEFVIINRKEAINTRMRDLLNDLNLSKRLVDEDYRLSEILKKIDYRVVKSILNHQITFSKKYLSNVLKINNDSMRKLV